MRLFSFLQNLKKKFVLSGRRQSNPENWLSRCLRVLPKSLGYDAFLIENILKGCVVHSTIRVECSEQPLYTM